MALHEHTHTVFIEVTFALNTVFSGYRDFEKVITEKVEEQIQKLGSWAKTVETNSTGESTERLADLIDWLGRTKRGHIRVQKSLYAPVVLWASGSALYGLAALYWDWVEWMDWWCGVLALPTLVYLALVLLNFAIFWLRGAFKIGLLQFFHLVFDKRRQPPSPPGNGNDVPGKS